MAIDVTIYMLRQGATDLAGVIPPEKQGPGEFEEVQVAPGVDLGFPAVGYVRQVAPRAPGWLPWFAAAFAVGNLQLQTQSAGAIILFHAKFGNRRARIFAVVFGTGWHAIPDDLIEPDFGLRVALNEVDPKDIRGLVTKTIDARTRERNTYRHAGGDVADFALDVDAEWLRSAAGAATTVKCTAVTGGQSLKLHGWNGQLPQLRACCAQFIRSFFKQLPEAFSFAEHVRPIGESEPEHAQLMARLEQLVRARDFDQLSVAVDSGVAAHAAKQILTLGKQRYELQGLTEDELHEQLDVIHAADPAFVVTRVRLKVFDSSDGLLLDTRLLDVLQAEVELAGDLFIRLERRWFKTGADYVAGVDRRIARIPDLSGALGLPVWDKATHPEEEDYNALASGTKAWLNQDQEFINVGGALIEPCDVLTPARQFLCVKEGSTSSKLSHLFAQASGSADLLARHAPFEAEIRARYAATWPGSDYSGQPLPTFVFVIGRKAGQPLFGKMLLSKINALEHARRINELGYNVSVCRVTMA